MIKRILIILFCLFGLAAGLAGFFLFSEKGLQTSVALVSRLTAGRVHIGLSQGKILGDWRLEKITIHSDQVDIAIDDMSCSWQPKLLLQRVLQAAELSFSGIDIILKNQGDGGSAEAFIPPGITLPFSFLIGTMVVDQLEVKRLGGESLFVLDSFSTRLSATTNRLEFSDVDFKSPYLSGTATARLTMSGDWPIEAAAGWQAKIAGCSDLRGTARVSQMLTDLLIDLQLNSPVMLDLEVGVSDLFGDISYRADMKGSGLVLGDICAFLPEAVVDLHLQAGGGLDGSEGAARSTMLFPGALPLSAEIDFGVDGQALTIKNGTLGYGENKAAVSGELEFAPQLSWDSVITAESFDLSDLLPVPATSIDTRIYLSGKRVDEGIVYTANVGTIEVSVNEYDLLLDGGLAINGDLQGLEVTSCRFDCGEGTIDLVGSLSWADGFQWEGDVRLESFDPSEIDSLPQGSISGSFFSRGHISDSDLMIETQIDSLSGELSGYELSGGGNLLYQDQVLTVAGLNITNGQNRLYALGTVDDNFDLEFTVNGAELERIYPLLGGNLEIIGSLSGPRSEPRARLVIESSGLVYQNYSVGNVAAEIDAALVDRAVKSNLQLETLQLGDFTADVVDLSIDGTLENHRLSGAVELDRGRLQTDINGEFKNNFWQAQILALAFNDHQFGTWKQNGSAKVRVAAESASLERTCFSAAENRICAAGTWQQEGSWSLSIDDLAFSMDSLNNWGLLDQKITGTLAASLQLSGSQTAIVSGSGKAAIDKLQLAVGPNEFYEDLTWFDTALAFTVEHSDLSANLSTRFVDDSSLKGSVIFTGAGNFTSWNKMLPIQGNIDVDIRDISFLSTLTSDFLLPAGSLSGSLNLAGSVADPSVAGTVDLQEGELRVPMLGINLSNVAGTIEAGSKKLLLELDSMSGDGTLHSSGEFDFGREPWRGALTFSGRGTKLLDRRAITVVADPQLALDLGAEGGSLSGKITVSQALIEVEKIDRSSSESSDVVFVDNSSESTPWPFHYDIEVTLGDDVQVTGNGLNGKLGGHLSVASSSGGITVGRGYLDVVDGSFAIYGSPLQIARGRLSFGGGPVDNPSLDIKASKFIEETRFGYSGVEVGVNVTGSAANFEMDLYSVPKMENADILAYIILDKPISTEGDAGTRGLINSAAQAIGMGKGSDLLTDVSAMLPVDDIRVEGGIESQETSVVVGKKLSKELSVSYDYNLFKNAGSFRVRYDFGKGFSVESRNSMESNGVELLYSLER